MCYPLSSQNETGHEHQSMCGTTNRKYMHNTLNTENSQKYVGTLIHMHCLFLSLLWPSITKKQLKGKDSF